MDWNSCLSNGIPTLSCITILYRIALGAALGLAGVVTLFLLLAASIKYITSGGGKQVEEAKNMITYAIVGLVLILSAVFIINLIAGITGVECILSFGTVSCR